MQHPVPITILSAISLIQFQQEKFHSVYYFNMLIVSAAYHLYIIFGSKESVRAALN